MESFSKNLLDWYDLHARILPWRVGPKESKAGLLPDPYHVWLSEVMLQQTTVATVGTYFSNFLNRWPNLTDLAKADREDVMREWAGLGYYSRARNLKKCAEIVANELNGKFPDDEKDLVGLPGIGPYTACAIAAIAFNKPAPAVDGNIERVVSRQTANATPLPKLKADCRDFMVRQLPDNRAGDFVQAMMDLGATICRPKSPNCVLCPVNSSCTSYQSGTALDFPVKMPKKAKPRRIGAAFVARRDDGAIWLVKRPDKGLLGGMSALPDTGWTASKNGGTGEVSAPFGENWIKKGKIRHVFTHFHLEMEVWTASTIPKGEGWWSPLDEIANEALPTVMVKALRLVLDEPA